MNRLHRHALAAALTLCSLPAFAARPSYDCTKPLKATVEEQICADEKLAALDRKLAETYKAAQAKTKGKDASLLKAEQSGWIKGRNDCWKNPGQQQCISDNYTQRIAELQARFSLLAASASAEYLCEDDSVPIRADFFPTDPPSIQARRGDETQILMSVPSGNQGSRYEGRNVSLFEHDGETLITWGAEGTQKQCKKK